MKSRLPIFAGFTLAAVLAGAAAAHRQRLSRVAQSPGQSPAASVASAPTVHATNAPPAAELIAGAVAQMQRHPSFAAKLRHRVDILGHAMTGSGTYAQGPWGERRWRMELKIQAGEDLTTWQQVSDGHSVWTFQQLIGNPKLYRVDLERVDAALAAGEAAQGSAGGIAPLDGLALGGLPRLLADLKNSFEFTEVREARLGGEPVWIVRGRWTREMLAALLPRQQDRLAAGEPFHLPSLADHVPDEVEVTLAQKELLPYRIEYLRSVATLSDEEREAGLGERTLVGLELFEIHLGGAIDPVQFTYNPGSQPVADGTAEFLRKLGVAP